MKKVRLHANRAHASFLVIALCLTGCSSSPGTAKRNNLPPYIRVAGNATEHEDYYRALINRVDENWDRIVARSGRNYPPSGTKVMVTFLLEAETGDVPKILKVDTGGSKHAALMCVDAIMAGAPYGSWTSAMKNTLGDSSELTFTFNYQ